jgi:NAD(P)-dependent dehydrogenase (short-subunit alcohol dehydrogenase family)
MDLGEVDAIAGWVRQAALQHGPFNGLVHAAGIHRLLPLSVASPGKIEELFRVNVTAGLMLLKGFRHKDCFTGPASAVLVSSVAALSGDPGAAPYAAAKAALLGVTRSLAAELAPRIRVNCVVPGMVRTGMASQIGQVLGSEKMAALESRHPLGFGEPADVAAGIAFLLSPAARWMTGSQLVMDGGYTAI